jgi:hypothetical protein
MLRGGGFCPNLRSDPSRSEGHPERPATLGTAMLLMSLPRVATSNGANGGRLIFLLCLILLFFLGLLLLHPLVSVSPHFLEVLVRITRVPV